MRRWTTDKKNVSGKKRIFYCPSVHRRRWMKYHKRRDQAQKAGNRHVQKHLMATECLAYLS